MYHQLFELQEETFKVIANRKRLEIIHLLQGKELSVSEMVVMLGIHQSNLSQHLSLLRQARLVEARRDGQNVYYSLTDERLSETFRVVRDFLQEQHRLGPAANKLLRNERPNLYPLVRDPVCDMRLTRAEIGATTTHEGKTYYFCASGCEEKFRKKPARFTKKLEPVERR